MSDQAEGVSFSGTGRFARGQLATRNRNANRAVFAEKPPGPTLPQTPHRFAVNTYGEEGLLQRQHVAKDNEGPKVLL